MLSFIFCPLQNFALFVRHCNRYGILSVVMRQICCPASDAVIQCFNVDVCASQMMLSPEHDQVAEWFQSTSYYLIHNNPPTPPTPYSPFPTRRPYNTHALLLNPAPGSGTLAAAFRRVPCDPGCQSARWRRPLLIASGGCRVGPSCRVVCGQCGS